ncbi:hypothetical protein IV203_017252 [Nitzschia inconspicua]|uniref:Uncharacterized protein n=1 Tax=Nitzschia inconspicua TaxID=303405 RepID=A0A9K3KS66_9STRA|nr:hypothetical protein IV203_017252 [Nitzschia inconspicua]
MMISRKVTVTIGSVLFGILSLGFLLYDHSVYAFVTPSQHRHRHFSHTVTSKPNTKQQQRVQHEFSISTTTTSSTFASTKIHQRWYPSHSSSFARWAQNDDDNDDDETENENDGTTKKNPYQDPNYPDLEFVDYSDPEYQVDQGVGDEFFDPTSSSSSSSSTEAQVELMREERRVKNDEYQFETYYKEILKEGQEFKGEWMVYHTSTFTDGETDENSRPRLAKAAGPIKVISRGERVQLEPTESDDNNNNNSNSNKNRLEYQRILHHEKVSSDIGSGNKNDEEKRKTTVQLEQEKKSMETKYWPDQLSFADFRGHQGIMCVGNAYTICTATPLSKTDIAELQHEGPFADYRAELGLLSESMRFRIKVDYSVLESETDKETSLPPPLHLRSLTVCRETLGMWPRAENYQSAMETMTRDALWGPRGAHGGLYDPPPVGSEAQASQYLLLDLEGRATVLLPYLMDQDPQAQVISLDWAPGRQRYQVDRKTNGGKGLLGLRTLELSEVQSADADTYRPRDGGRNMRQ